MPICVWMVQLWFLFFLEHTEELRIIILRREKAQNRPLQAAKVVRVQKERYKIQKKDTTHTTHYGQITFSTGAPVKHHKRASPLMSSMILVTLGGTLSKTQALQCFHSHQATRATKELKPPLLSLGTLSTASLHQSCKTIALLSGSSGCKSICESTENQTCLEKTQATRRCCTVSSSWSQSGQYSGWSKPRRARRSAVQQQFKRPAIGRICSSVAPMSSRCE